MSATEEHRVIRPEGRLLSWLPHGAVAPDHGGFCISSIPGLVSAALGLADRTNPLVEAFDPPDVDRVLLVILDGLGQNRWDALRVADPRLGLARIAANGKTAAVTSVFPSTTVAALASYSTGLSPLAHGMLGYRLFLRELSATVNMIQLSVVGGGREAPLPSSFDVQRLLPSITVYERLHEAGVTTHALLPRGITDSGLSQLLYRGCDHIHPAIGLSDTLALARDILQRSAGKTAVTLYWPGLDSIAHSRGAESTSYEAEAAAIGTSIERELLGRVGRTLLVLSSDHGFATMDPKDYAPLSDFPNLREAVLLFPTGEPRASYLHLRPDSRARLPWRLPTVLDGGLLLFDTAAAVQAGLFGLELAHPESARRLGDVALASTDRRGIQHPYPDAPLLRGMHGGLSADEMLVPLIVAPL